jgi:hypothetical protein
MSRRNRTVVQILAVLHVIQQGALCSRCFLILRDQSLPSNPTYAIDMREGTAGARDSHRLHDPWSGAAVEAASLPLATVTRGVYLFLPTVLLFRLPMALLMAYVAFAPSCRQLFARRYEAFLCAACCVEAMGGLVLELGVLHLLGIVLEYPQTVCFLHVVFNVVVHINGPVRPQWNWPMWVVKAITQLGVISFFPALWAHTWRWNAGVWVQQLASAACVARARGNDAALRELWRQEKARSAAAKKLA